MMAMLQFCLLVFVLVGCQIHSVESAVSFPTDSVVVSISKKPALNSAVVTVNATGADTPAFTYTIKSQSPTQNVFSIDGLSGAITVTNVTQLNYPTTKEYTLEIEAAQSGASATTTVTVNLVNKEPTFAKALYTVCVNKTLPAGTVVVQVAASDGDDEDTLTYSITAGNENSMFTLGPSNGTIKVATGKTIGETPASYNLTMTATDNDQAFDTTTVSINVADPCPATPPKGNTTLQGNTPPPNFATTMTASFCLFLISVSVHLLCIC